MSLKLKELRLELNNRFKELDNKEFLRLRDRQVEFRDKLVMELTKEHLLPVKLLVRLDRLPPESQDQEDLSLDSLDKSTQEDDRIGG